ncbi:unnamed protein product [Gadus morhua 'NCC']
MVSSKPVSGSSQGRAPGKTTRGAAAVCAALLSGLGTGTSMDARKNRTPALPDPSGWPSLFLRQPPRVLIVEALPPWWSQTGPVLCEALDNFLSLACSVAGPCRVPLLSLYAVSRQQECLLPFVHLSGNLPRLRSCVEELRSLPGEGCVRAPPRGACGGGGGRGGGGGGGGGGELLRQAVLDCLQQYNQYTRHMSAGSGTSNNTSLEVTVVTSQPGRGVVRRLEAGLRGVDLVSLRRLLVLEISNAAGDWGRVSGSPEEKSSAEEGLTRLNATSSLLRVDSICMEGWTLRMEGVCESVMYGLPMVLRPTSCWQLDWDELESNHDLFHALCHTLRSRDLFLLVRSDTARSPAAPRPGLQAHYVLQASPFSSLLLKPVVSRELLLPCPLPASAQDPRPDTLHAIQGSLAQLDEDSVFNPLSVTSNLYQHLKNRALLSRPKYPYRVPQAARRDQPLPPEGAKASHMRPPRQQGHLGPPPTHKVRATVAPLPSSSSFASCQGPPPSKASRPALTFLSSGGRAPRAPPVSYTEEERDPEEEEDFLMPL